MVRFGRFLAGPNVAPRRGHDQPAQRNGVSKIIVGRSGRSGNDREKDGPGQRNDAKKLLHNPQDAGMPAATPHAPTASVCLVCRESQAAPWRSSSLMGLPVPCLSLKGAEMASRILGHPVE